MRSIITGLDPRGATALVFGAFVATAVVVVFAGTLTRATELERQVALASAAVEELEGRLAAGDVELRFIESDEFVQQQARALGFGERGERAFRLPDDAPSPPPVPVLGEVAGPTLPTTPLDDWMELLFGA
jgi:hypothetical protein